MEEECEPQASQVKQDADAQALAGTLAKKDGKKVATDVTKEAAKGAAPAPARETKKEEPEVPGFEVKLPAPAAAPGSRKKKKKKKKKATADPASAPVVATGGPRTLASATVAEIEAAKVARKVKASNGNDLDALLNEIKVYVSEDEPAIHFCISTDMDRDPTKCKFGTCSRPVHLMGTVCKLCAYTYCQRHSLPEVHGCGQAARAAARATLTAPRQLRDRHLLAELRIFFEVQTH